MPYETATIAGSIFDWVTTRQKVRVLLTRLEGSSPDGNNAHLSGLKVQYSPSAEAVAPVVAVGTYRVIIEPLESAKSFPKRDFIAPINGDTSWGEVLSYDGTGYEYTPDELARLVAVEQAATGYAAHSTTGSLTLAGAGMHVLTLTGNTTLALTGSNGASVALVVHLNGHTLTVEGQAVEADGLALLYKAEGAWVLASTSAATDPVDPELTPATPAFPLTYTDDGTTRTYVIPTTTGVDYKVGGTTQTAGTKTATPNLEVTVTPVAQATYALTSSTPWTHTFATDPSDTTPPTAPTLSVDNSSQTQLVATISGGTDSVGVTQYRSRIDGGSWFTGASKTFAGLTAGTSHTIDAQAGDAAGNWSTSTSDTKSTAAPPSADSVILSDNPDYYFKLNDVGGTTNPANLGSGSVVATAGSGVTFDGTKATFTGAGGITFASDVTAGLTAFTIEAVLTQTTDAGGGFWFCAPTAIQSQRGTGGAFRSLTVWSGGTVYDYYQGAPGGTAELVGTAHVAVTYDGSMLKFYENGALKSAVGGSASGAVDGASAAVAIGYKATNAFVGSIRRFVLKRGTALSQTRIQAHATALGF